MASLLAGLRNWFSDPSRRFIPLFFVYLAIATWLSGKAMAAKGRALNILTAQIDHTLLSWFTDKATIHGSILTYDGFSVVVIGECTGVYEAVIYAAGVLAYVTPWRKRVIGLAGGLPAIYAFNLLRINVLLLVGRHWPDQFEFFHVYFWQATLVLMITSVWVAWLHFVVRE